MCTKDGACCGRNVRDALFYLSGGADALGEHDVGSA